MVGGPGAASLRQRKVTAGFLGSAANVIMQLGWREVGYSVVESSVDSGNVMLHPCLYIGVRDLTAEG